jgi:hypothetical protein
MAPWSAALNELLLPPAKTSLVDFVAAEIRSTSWP